MKVNYKLSENNIHFTGEQNMSFTDFNLEPPTAVFETLKIGNNIKISFAAAFKPEE